VMIRNILAQQPPKVAAILDDHVVGCNNSIDSKSSRIPIMVVQHPTEPLSPSDGALTSVRVGRQRLDQLIAEPLVVPLLVVVRRTA
jgi:hypothetical protein